MKPEFVIFSTDAEQIERLRSQSSHLPYVSYSVGNGPVVTKLARLDALKVSQMDAVQRYGFNPPHPLLEARVLKAPTALVERGLPRYAISGVALPEDYRRDTRSEMELVISAMLKAVRDFNAEGGDQIQRIGVLPEGLSLDKLPAPDVFETLDRIYGELVTA